MTTTAERPYAEMINAGLESMLPPAYRMAITITDARMGFAAAEVPVARIQAEVEAVGKAEFVLDAELTDEDGTVVANSHGVYQLRRFGT